MQALVLTLQTFNLLGRLRKVLDLLHDLFDLVTLRTQLVVGAKALVSLVLVLTQGPFSVLVLTQRPFPLILNPLLFLYF